MNPNLMEQISEIERLVHRSGQAPNPLVQDHNQLIIMDQPKPLKDYFILNQYQPSSYIQLPQHQAAQYEIKSSTIQMLLSFYENTNEDPYKHLDEFLEICLTVKI